MLHELHVGVWVEACDLLAAVVPHALESVAQSLLAMHLEDVLFQGLEIVQLD